MTYIVSSGTLNPTIPYHASSFKYGTQIGFGTSLPKNDAKDQNWTGSRLGEHPKKFVDPLHIFATIEASKFKFGTQLGFGTSSPKTTIWTKIHDLDQNWRGSLPGEYPKKIGTLYVFLQPLKLAASNVLHSIVAHSLEWFTG